MTVSLSAGPLLRPVNAEKRPSFVEELLRHFAKSTQSPEKLAGPAPVLFLVPMRESGIILWVFFFPGQEKSRSYRPAELKQLHTHIHTHSQTHTHTPRSADIPQFSQPFFAGFTYYPFNLSIH